MRDVSGLPIGVAKISRSFIYKTSFFCKDFMIIYLQNINVLVECSEYQVGDDVTVVARENEQQHIKNLVVIIIIIIIVMYCTIIIIMKIIIMIIIIIIIMYVLYNDDCDDDDYDVGGDNDVGNGNGDDVHLILGEHTLWTIHDELPQKRSITLSLLKH